MPSNGIVLELQRDCLDPQVSISAILRKAKAIASKLDLDGLSHWIDQELNGYRGKLKDLPGHRKAGGSPKFWNPYNGWCPIIASDPTLSEILTTANFAEPVAQLEEWISNKQGTLTYRYPHYIQEHLNKSSDIPIEAVMHISPTAIISALDFVRNKVLEWTLELEKRGIVGAEFTFAQSQKREAQIVTNHIYGGNIGVLGNVSGDAVSSRFVSAQGVDVHELRSFLEQARPAANGLDSKTKAEVEPLLLELEKEVSGAAESTKVGSLLRSMKAVLEGAGGNLVASALLAALAG